MNKNNIPAFPNPALGDENWIGFDGCEGMSLRDYFAAQAMNGIYAGRGDPVALKSLHLDADLSYKIADAMMAARDK